MAITSENPIDLVLGVSSAGKSTFIEQMIKESDQRAQVIMGHEIEECGSFNPGNERVIVHYNMLRVTEKSGNLLGLVASEPILQEILVHKARARATILVVPKSVIQQRVMTRKWVEPNLRDHRGRIPYPRTHILSSLDRIDLPSLYAVFINLMIKEEIPCAILDSATNQYKQIKKPSEALRYLAL